MEAPKTPSRAELRAFRDEWIAETGEPMTLRVAEVLWDQMMDARYEREASGGNIAPAPVEESVPPMTDALDPDAAYERFLENQGEEER